MTEQINQLTKENHDLKTVLEEVRQDLHVYRTDKFYEWVRGELSPGIRMKVNELDNVLRWHCDSGYSTSELNSWLEELDDDELTHELIDGEWYITQRGTVD